MFVKQRSQRRNIRYKPKQIQHNLHNEATNPESNRNIPFAREEFCNKSTSPQIQCLQEPAPFSQAKLDNCITVDVSHKQTNNQRATEGKSVSTIIFLYSSSRIFQCVFNVLKIHCDIYFFCGKLAHSYMTENTNPCEVKHNISIMNHASTVVAQIAQFCGHGESSNQNKIHAQMQHM